MSEKDFYRILGVEKGAGDEDIKKAYRRLAHELHPDKHPGDKEKEERFKLINEAYETLKDPEKRANYDRFGYAGAAGGPGVRGQGFGMDFEDIFSEVFSDFFGRGRPRQAPERGSDLRYDLEITLEEACKGVERPINIPRLLACPSCNGTGAKHGTQPQACASCRGSGQVRFQQGFFTISRTCGNCGGKGFSIKDPCHECRGSGRVRSQSQLTVRIPPGVDTGSKLRISGEGERGGMGGPPGDLYIVVSVKPHEIFARQDDDIICEVPVSFTQVALGTEIEVPTLEGPARLKIPPGTQTGKAFRLKGKGMPSLHTGRRGDCQVVVRVETPAKLTKRQRELLEELAGISGEDAAPLRKNLFSKMKDIFE